MLRYEHGGNIYGENHIELDFSVNINPMGMPEAAQKALADEIASYPLYPDCECRRLRAALARRHHVATEQILCGNGASDLILRICAALRPQTALVLAPTFSEYRRSATLCGTEIREFPLLEKDDYALTDKILTALEPPVDILFLCNPNNPTGRLVPPQMLRAILDQCRKNNILTVLDECFIGFTDAPSAIPMLSDYPQLLILNAFTKLYGMAGLRLGYLLGAAPLLETIKPFGPEWSVSTPAQVAGLAALSDSQWETRTRELIRQERTVVRVELNRLGLTVFPSDSSFLLIKSKKPLAEPLLEQGILVRACDNFTGLDSQYIRIGLKTRGKNMALISALREVLHG